MPERSVLKPVLIATSTTFFLALFAFYVGVVHLSSWQAISDEVAPEGPQQVTLAVLAPGSASIHAQPHMGQVTGQIRKLYEWGGEGRPTYIVAVVDSAGPDGRSLSHHVVFPPDMTVATLNDRYSPRKDFVFVLLRWLADGGNVYYWWLGGTHERMNG